jgi:hypothetical protein
MFKMASCEDEIFQSMEKNLIANQTENVYGFNKLASAVDFLDKAAAIFEKAGMTEIAEDISKVLESLSGDLK